MTALADIAVIGMAVRAKQANNLEDLRRVLSEGQDMIGDFPASRRSDAAPFLADAWRYPLFGGKASRSFGLGAFLDDVDKFDASYFKISPAEAAVMDPSQRLLLECGMSCLEAAGYPEDAVRSTSTGVFVGYMPDFRPFNYRDLAFKTTQYTLDQVIGPNLISVIPSRLSYFLDLRGPTVCIDTSCSSGLLAIHLACQSIWSGSCDQALAGAVKLNLAPFADLARPVIESPAFRSRVFDVQADGIGLGEGAGVVMLKPLDKAKRDGDHIWCVVKASTVNQDGRSNGLACPNGAAQTRNTLSAWDAAGVNPDDIGYIEAHGTGTRVGDPIELGGLAMAFAHHTEKRQFCGVGSVKANYGHWYEAAGILGFIKAALSVHHGELYPQIGLTELIPEADLVSGPLFIPLNHEPWPSDGDLRIAGVNSFGVSGTNAHIVISNEPPGKPAIEAAAGPYVFVASAPSHAQLRLRLEEYADFLEQPSGYTLQDICYTSAVKRDHHEHRAAFVAASREVLVADIRSWLCRGAEAGSPSSGDAPSEDICSGADRMSRLRRTQRTYLQGGPVDWFEIFPRSARVVPIPTYPFKRERHWLKFDQAYLDNVLDPSPIRHYSIQWVPAALDAEASNQRLSGQRLLVLHRNQPRAQELDSSLRERGASVTTLSTAWELDADDLEQFDHIVHIATIDAPPVTTTPQLRESQEFGVLGAFHIISALQRRVTRSRISLHLITECAAEVTRGETDLRPEYATLAALGRIVGRESSTVQCHAIDIEPSTPTAQILAAILTPSPSYQRALRGADAYTQEFAPLVLEQPVAGATLPVREDGFYLITGGTGGLGLAFAGLLAERGASKIVLASRSGAPHTEEKRQSLAHVESSGAEVHLLKLDAGDPDAVKEEVGRLQREFGTLRGVVHAAGIPGSHLTGKQSLEEFGQVADPKIYGAFALADALAAAQPDFVIFYSSVAALFPALGQGDYCAANAYLDALTLKLRKDGVRAHSVDWVAWKEAGMAFDLGANVNTTFCAISTQDAHASLERAILSDVGVCLIGELNTDPENLEILTSYRIPLAASIKNALQDRHAGPVPFSAGEKRPLAQPGGRSGGGYTSLECALAEAWGEVLGYEKVDVSKDIYDLGADSIAMAKIAAICVDRGIVIEISDIVTHGTIEGIAASRLSELTAAQAVR